MRFRKPKKTPTTQQRILRRGVAALALLFCGIIWVDSLVRPAVETYTAYQSRSVSTEIINETVLQVLEEENLTYEDIIQVQRGADGRVLSVLADSVAASRLRALLTQQVSRRLEALSYETIRVPLGTMLRLQLLTGRGPEIAFRVRPASYVAGTLVSEMEAAGINQTRHRIGIHLQVEMAAVMPGYSTTVTVEAEVALAETLLLGDIPQTYLHF